MSLERFGVVPMSFQKWKLVYTNQLESGSKSVTLNVADRRDRRDSGCPKNNDIAKMLADHCDCPRTNPTVSSNDVDSSRN